VEGLVLTEIRFYGEGLAGFTRTKPFLGRLIVLEGIDWIRDVFGFALVPDVVFYLHADLAHLIPRVLNARGFDFWESGLDFLANRDRYEAFVEYQTRLLAQFDSMAQEFDFHRIDASVNVRDVFRSLQAELEPVLSGLKPIPPQEAEQESAHAVTEEKHRRKKDRERAAPLGEQN
jgi:dTMP kinase